jgi:hypothetical protein
LLLFFCLVASGSDGVEEEHGDGHGADAAGDGGDEGRFFFYVFEIDVANEPESRFFGGVIDAINADIDNDGAGFNHVGGDGIERAGGGDDDIGATRVVGEIFCAGVADGDCGVAEGAFLDEDIGQGFTDDIASANDYDVGAFDFDAGFEQKLNDAVRGAGEKSFLARNHFAYVDRMKAVDILGGVDGEKDLRFVDMFWQRELDKDTVNFRVFVQFVDNRQ